MTPLAWTLVIAVTASVAILWLGPGAIVRWRLARLKVKPILVGAAMRLIGITPKDADASGRGSELWQAAERCTKCADTQACRVALATGSRRHLDESCPNRQFFHDIERHKAVCAVAGSVEDDAARAPGYRPSARPSRPVFPMQ